MAQRITFSEFVEEYPLDDRQLEELQRWHENPININTATPQQLLALPLLDEGQVEDIETYVFLHGGMRSLAELMAIRSIDFHTRQLLELFLVAGEMPKENGRRVTPRSLWQGAKHELTTRVDIPLYYRAGYSYPIDEGGYMGSPLYHRMQYRMTNRDNLSLMVMGEKDAGEPFRNNRGWDSYGMHLQLSNIGRCRTLVVGDYRVGFGEGLVVNTSSTFHNSFVAPDTRGIRGRTGGDELHYLRGAAGTVSLGHGLQMSAWTSLRNTDATMTNEGTVRTLRTDGLHRTEGEMRGKNQVTWTTVGGDMSWQGHGFRVGATGYWLHSNKRLTPADDVWHQWYPRGKQWGSVGVHYGYSSHVLNISGETAMSNSRETAEQGTPHTGLATLNRMTWRPTGRYALTLLQRWYARRYNSMLASSVSNNGKVGNESGVTLRMDAKPMERMSVTTHLDFFHNPWPRYHSYTSCDGAELQLQPSWEINGENTISGNYQWKMKSMDGITSHSHSLRMQHSLVTGHWRMKTAVAMKFLGTNPAPEADIKPGLALSETVRYQSTKDVWRTELMATYFSATDYDSRIYLYEPSLLLSGTMPMLYGRGVRMVMTMRWTHPSKRWLVEMKYGGTRLTNRDTQGTDMQLIDSPWKNDISIQVRMTMREARHKM